MEPILDRIILLQNGSFTAHEEVETLREESVL
ncbi:ABC-type multidrug transport system ATPase subunit [Lysinibacillus sp. RC46]